METGLHSYPKQLLFTKTENSHSTHGLETTYTQIQFSCVQTQTSVCNRPGRGHVETTNPSLFWRDLLHNTHWKGHSRRLRRSRERANGRDPVGEGSPKKRRPSLTVSGEIKTEVETLTEFKIVILWENHDHEGSRTKGLLVKNPVFLFFFFS